MANVMQYKPIDATDRAAVLEAIMNYKKQNPAKFEAKKEAIFKRYGIELEEQPILEPVKDETDVKLEKLKEKASKK